MITKNIMLPHNFFSPTSISKFVQISAGFSSTISLKYGLSTANAKSPLSILCIKSEYPADVEIIADGPDEKKAIADLCSYINKISKELY